MSLASTEFIRRLGKPEKSASPGITFPGDFDQFTWEKLYKEIQAGWYLNHFVYLFGEQAINWHPLLTSWAFLFKEDVERIVIGRNAYGALLVMEEFSVKGVVAPIYLMDPLRVRYWGDPNLDFMGLIGNWLPQEKIPGFLDTGIFEAWLEQTGALPEEDEILAIKAPLSLGGKMELSNFQVENIFDYYATTAPIYEKALNKK